MDDPFLAAYLVYDKQRATARDRPVAVRPGAQSRRAARGTAPSCAEAFHGPCHSGCTGIAPDGHRGVEP